MKLTPITSAADPSYPIRPVNPGSPSWKKIAAAVGAAVAMWLPACGEDDTCPTRSPGITPMVNEVRTPGEAMPADLQTNTVPEGKKPPELPQPVYSPPPVPNDQSVRVRGSMPSPSINTPPEPKPPEEPVRLAGRRAPPRLN